MQTTLVFQVTFKVNCEGATPEALIADGSRQIEALEREGLAVEGWRGLVDTMRLRNDLLKASWGQS